MNYFFYIPFFIFGTLIGSFLNVVILRYNTGVSISGRSSCLSCSKKLEWYHLIPILSFIYLKGKCFFCRSRISVQYPLVELLTGVVFLLILEKYFFVQSGFLTAIFLIIWSTLIAILVYDIKHMIIPDSLVYLFIGLSFFQIILSPSFSIQNIDWLHILAGPILFIPFFLLWLISGGKLIGLGDAKTAWGIGWLVGLQIGFGGIVLAFWIGAVYSIFVLLVKYILSFVDEDNKLYLKLKKFRMKSEIPFAPFLILSLFFVWYFNVDILDLFFLI